MSHPNTTVTLTLGVKHPVTFTLLESDLNQITALFPRASYQLRNKHHAAIATRDYRGEKVDLYLRRIIADLMLREQGVLLAKGYSVETRNGNPLDLRRANLKIVRTAERISRDLDPRRNGWHTHQIIGVRLKALSEGLCPDEAMEAVAFEWLRKNAANDNGEGDGEEYA